MRPPGELLTALQNAASLGNKAGVEYLLRNHADIDAFCEGPERTAVMQPLQLAQQNGFDEVAELLTRVHHHSRCRLVASRSQQR